MNSSELKFKTKSFALKIVTLLRALPRDFIADCLTKQLIRSSTSVAANYRAACRAKSKSDFIYKIGIVLEEADESLFWLEMLTEAGLVHIESTKDLLEEANQITAIFAAIKKTSVEIYKS